VLFKLGLLRKDSCVTVQREDLVADVVGGTAKLTKKRIKDAAGGVLFVDEAYRLFPKDADPKDFGREAVDELMAAMLEEDAPVMIFAGYPKLMDGFLLANPGLRSRIPTTLEFDDYSWAELATIMDQVVTKKRLSPYEEREGHAGDEHLASLHTARRGRRDEWEDVRTGIRGRKTGP